MIVKLSTVKIIIYLIGSFGAKLPACASVSDPEKKRKLYRERIQGSEMSQGFW